MFVQSRKEGALTLGLWSPLTPLSSAMIPVYGLFSVLKYENDSTNVIRFEDGIILLNTVGVFPTVLTLTVIIMWDCCKALAQNSVVSRYLNFRPRISMDFSHLYTGETWEKYLN